MTREEKILKFLCEKDPCKYDDPYDGYSSYGRMFKTKEEFYNQAASKLADLKTQWLEKQIRKITFFEDHSYLAEELYPLIFGEDDET